MKMNKCYYSEGSKHSCCTHPHYCIFNKKRWILEKKLTELFKEYKKWDTLRIGYVLGNYVPMEYDEIIRKMNVIEEDIKQLNRFKQKVLAERIDGYGHEILES